MIDSSAGGCVRFDVHAVYLGTPSRNQSCPSWLIGTTESILIEPGPARVDRTSVEELVARQVAVRAPGIVITATFDADPKLVDRILASAKLPAPTIDAPSLDGTAEPAGGRAPHMHYPMARPPLPATVTSYTGLGFDSCSAPSSRYMRAWRRRSPYRAVGIYIGGADRACAQPNLGPGWVRRQAQYGWRFMPLYAGPQAAFGELGRPDQQGRAAAVDAVGAARRLGFGPHTPLYYDMEAYGPRSRVHALRFLSAWTRMVHRLGYRSGVYSSSDSGIVDLARQYRNHHYAMPDIIFDALWNGSRTTRDRNLLTRQWARHRRIHQFRGNVTRRYGGDRLNIDVDFLNVRAGAAALTSQQTPAVRQPDGAVLAFYVRSGKQLWLAREPPRRGAGPGGGRRNPSGWTKPVATGADAFGAPSAVWTGTQTAVFYKDRAGYLWVSYYRLDGKLASRRRLTMMGILGSSPRAVSSTGGVIDVFWRGSVDDHLWHGQFTPGSGWNGPQGLGGDLASPPSVVTSSPGLTAVFWKGTNGCLWAASRGISGKWGAPRNLGMARVGGAPQATSQPNGSIEVYWGGFGNPLLWEAFFNSRRHWQGPRDLGGDIGSVPLPVSAAGAVRVLWRDRKGQLQYTEHRPGDGWNVLSWTGSTSGHHPITAEPFAAVGGAGGQVPVFWHGKRGALWTAVLDGPRLAHAVRLS
ncbi:MAG TPA: glycoside hydrolase domain-containing protein [Streptosporangiaceae bacterium]